MGYTPPPPPGLMYLQPGERLQFIAPGRVPCAYCGTSTPGNRCENCGAPKPTAQDSVITYNGIPANIEAAVKRLRVGRPDAGDRALLRRYLGMSGSRTGE